MKIRIGITITDSWFDRDPEKLLSFIDDCERLEHRFGMGE